MTMRSTPTQYGRVAITLHWSIAALILAALISGFAADAAGRGGHAALRVHAVTGLLAGFLMLVLINSTMKPQVRAVATDIENFTGIDGIVRSGAPDYFLIFGVLSLFGWVGGARIIRSQVFALRETEFVLAAESLGASRSRIIIRHLLPNIAPSIIVLASAAIPAAILAEAALSFLGLGIQPPTASWGGDMSGEARRYFEFQPWMALAPGIALTLTVLAFNLLGDTLRDVLDPRLRGTR